jgi:hypothetical protein
MGPAIQPPAQLFPTQRCSAGPVDLELYRTHAPSLLHCRVGPQCQVCPYPKSAATEPRWTRLRCAESVRGARHLLAGSPSPLGYKTVCRALPLSPSIPTIPRWELGTGHRACFGWRRGGWNQGESPGLLPPLRALGHRVSLWAVPRVHRRQTGLLRVGNTTVSFGIAHRTSAPPPGHCALWLARSQLLLGEFSLPWCSLSSVLPVARFWWGIRYLGIESAARRWASTVREWRRRRALLARDGEA